MQSNIKTWLDCVLQQMAAESYLDQFVLQGAALQQVFIGGNNDRGKKKVSGTIVCVNGMN